MTSRPNQATSKRTVTYGPNLVGKGSRTLRQRLPTTLGEGTGIQAYTEVESTTWAERKTFRGKLPELPCKDLRAAAEEAREHTDG